MTAGTTEWEEREMRESRESSETARRYQPNGEPLTNREAEILDHLIEEASEVIHAASKLKRFGKGHRAPTGPALTNSQTLGLEVGDFFKIMILAIECGLIDNQDTLDGVARKHERLKVFSKYLP